MKNKKPGFGSFCFSKNKNQKNKHFVFFWFLQKTKQTMVFKNAFCQPWMWDYREGPSNAAHSAAWEGSGVALLSFGGPGPGVIPR